MLHKVLKDIPQFLAGDETVLREILHPKNDEVDMNYSIAHAVLPIGKASLPHILNERSEVYFILQGEGEMHINQETKTLRKGDTVFIPAGAEQWIKNIGDGELEFLAMVSPPWTEESEEVF